MKHETVNFEALAKLRGISAEQARAEFEAALAASRKQSEDFLSAHPDLRQQFEAEYDRDTAFREQQGFPTQDRTAFLSGCVINYEMRQRILARATKIKASEIATEFGGELPPGWDDMLPPETIDDDITNA